METVLDGLLFPECPRWRQGELWFSDMHAGLVYHLDRQLRIAETISVPADPAGLGWLPNGDLVVVSMKGNRLYRYRGGELHHYADLESIHQGQSNDLVMDANGSAYVGNFGFDLFAGEKPRATCLVKVDPSGAVTATADQLMFPNGMVITGNRTLIVAETFAAQLTAFDIAEDGGLNNRRLWAPLGEYVPDGICLDAEGAIWVAACINHACIRVAEGGEILDTISTGELHPYACTLGGDDGKRLFLCNALDSDPVKTVPGKSGCIQFVDVAVPGVTAG